MYTFESLKKHTTQELHTIFKESESALFKNIKEYAFIGYNTNFLTDLLGFRNFIKVFTYCEEKRENGYNIIVSQKENQNHSTYIKRNKKGISSKQGFYSVYENKISNEDTVKGLVIDYQKGENPFFEPARLLKDYLVVPSAENPNLFLGKAFLNLNGKLFFLSYFVLERFKPLDQI
jgi:hypothetical protein